MSRCAVAQAVVTDPSSGRSSGYVLVAASPSVRPEDARHLTTVPQVTDYLHLEKSPGPYFSFYRLPSGWWAAVKRFVRGTRRGAFNRVVVHSLLMPPGALEALGGEPWLLWTRCRFRARGGGDEMTPTALTDLVGEPGLESLDDLEVSTEQEPRRERAALLEKRRDFLRGRWGDDELVERLRAVLAALATGRRVLLPQGAETEQLLAVAWSLLPARDRLETPWTTHLAPAVGNLFHLASCPDPRALRNEQEEPDCWALPLVETIPDDAGEDAPTLARALLAPEIDLGALDEGLEANEVRLSNAGQTRRWIVWLKTGEGLFASRSSLGAGPSPDELAKFFHDLRLQPREARSDRWLQPPHLLAVACGAALRALEEGRSLEDALRDVLQVLADTHWQGSLLTPEIVADLARIAPQDAALERVAVAVALVGRTLPKPPAERRQREALLETVTAALKARDRWDAPMLVPALVDLGVELALCESPRAGDAFLCLDSLPGGLDAVASRIGSLKQPFSVARALLNVAPRIRGTEAVARVAAESFFPLLTSDERLARGLKPEELEGAVAVLRERPDALAEVLRAGSDELYDVAMARLHAWSREAPQVVLGVMEELGADEGEPVRRRASIAGLAEELEGLGASPRVWLPFALVEAELGQDGSRRLDAFLAGVRIPKADAQALFDDVCEAVRRAVAQGRLSEAHRHLVEASSAGADARPEKAVAMAAKLDEVASEEFLCWASTIARLADELEHAAPEAASSLRGNYWHTLAARHRGEVPQEALEMLDGLRGDDRRRVADLWLPEIARLEKIAASKPLITALGSLVDSAEAEHRFHYNVGRLVLARRFGGLGLGEAVAQAQRLLRGPGSRLFMKRALAKLLPAQPRPRAGAVVGLLLAPSVLPSTKRVIETELLDPALKQAGRELAAVLPAVSELAVRGPLLLRAAEHLGAGWRGDVKAAEAFLREAARLGRYDAVASFLQASEAGSSGRSGGFLERLTNEGDVSLVRKLNRDAGENAAARVYLVPYRAALRRRR